MTELTIHNADALEFDFAGLAEDDAPLRLVGNLPYNISSPLLFKLVDLNNVARGLIACRHDFRQRVRIGFGNRRAKRVLARLDLSREYYDQQLKRTARHFRPYMNAVAQAPGAQRGLSLIADAQLALSADVDLFVRHVIETADPEKRGSMAWLSDFIAN